MEIVNTVYRGKLRELVDLKKLYEENIRIAKLYLGKPTQLKIELEGRCVLIFKSGAVRVMGKQCNLLDAMLSLCGIFWNENDHNLTMVPDTLTLQTMTLVGKCTTSGGVNLYELAKLIPSTYEFELFPAL